MRSCLLLSALAAVSTASIGNSMLESNSTTTVDYRDWPDTTRNTDSITIPPSIGPSHSVFIFPPNSISARPSGSLAKLPASRHTISHRSDDTIDSDQDNLDSTKGRDPIDDPDDNDDDDDDSDNPLEEFVPTNVGKATKTISFVRTVIRGPSTTKSTSTILRDLPSSSTSVQSTTLSRTVNGTRTRSRSSSSRSRTRQTSTLRTRTRPRPSRLSTTRSSSSSQLFTRSSSSASPTTTMTLTVNSTSATTRTVYNDGFPSSTTTVVRLVEPSSSINASSTVLVLVQPHVHSTTTILSTISTVSLQVSPTTSSTRRSSIRSSTSSSRRSSVRSSKSSSRRPLVRPSTSTRTKTLTETVSLPRSTKTSSSSKKSTMTSTETPTAQDLTIVLDIVSTKTTTARPSSITFEVVSTETTTARASTFLVEAFPKPTRLPTRSSMLTASTSTTTITVHPSPSPTVLSISSSTSLKIHGTSFRTRGLTKGPTHPISLRTKTVSRTTATTPTTTHFSPSSTGPSKLSILSRTKQKFSTGITKTKTLSSSRKISVSRTMVFSPITTAKVITKTEKERVTTTKYEKGRVTTTQWKTPRTKTTTAWRTKTKPSGITTKVLHHTRTKVTTVSTFIDVGAAAKAATVDGPVGPTGTWHRTGPTLIVSGSPIIVTVPGRRTTVTRGTSTTSTTVVIVSSDPRGGPESWPARARQIRGMNPGINDRKLGTFKGLGKDRKTVKFPNKHGSNACKAMSKKCKFPAKDDNTVLPCQERLAYEVFQLYEANPNQTFGRGEVVACLDKNTNYCASIDWQPWIQKSPKAGKLVEDLMTQRSLNDQDEVPIASVVESMNWMLDSDAQLCGETLLTVEKQRHSAGNNLGDMVGRYVLKVGTAPPKKQDDVFDGHNDDHFADDNSVDDDNVPWVKPSGSRFVFPYVNDNGDGNGDVSDE